MQTKTTNDTDLLTILLEEAKKNGASDADIILTKNKGLTITCRNGSDETVEQYESYDIGLRVFIGKRNVIISTNDTSKKKLKEFAFKAVEMAKIVPEDEFSKIASKDLLKDKPPLQNVNLETFDKNFPELDDLRESALNLETNALNVSKKIQSDGSTSSWNLSDTILMTSNGFLGRHKKTTNSLSIVLLSEKSNKKERDYDFSSKVFFDDLDDTAKIANSAAEKVLKKLGAEKPKTGHFPIIFEPRVAKTILGHIASAINGNAITRGTSFLKHSLNKKVFSDELNIIDDPNLKRGHGSRLFDAEGIGTNKINLICNGFLNNWLLDIASSSQLNTVTSGNAVRGLSSSPSPGTSNLTIQPGECKPSDFINSIEEGFLVTELIGSSVSIMTGDYSRGASGFWIRNGKISHPISEATIAGNLKEMFKTIIPANDLKMSGAISSPTLMIENMVVAGY